jgi:predicted oxidoreductase
VVRCARPAAARAGLPGYDALGPLKLLRTMPDIAGYDHSWFIVTRKIIEREFALSGWEQNPDITNRDYKLLLKSRLGRDRTAGQGVHGPRSRFLWSPAIFANWWPV